MDTHQINGEEAEWTLHTYATNVPKYHLEAKTYQRSCLYQELPLVANKVTERRMRLAGHCIRHPELTASSFVLWKPSKGKTSRGTPAIS